MTDKELKDMDETTSMDTTAAADTAAEAVDVNATVDDVLLSDVDELAFDVDFDDDDTDDADVATDVIGIDDGDRDGTVDSSNVADDGSLVAGNDDVDDETTGVDTTSAPAPADGGADVVAANADRVNAMLSLATPRESTDDDSSPDYIETPRSASSATAVSTHIDREVKVGDEDLNLLRAYPTLTCCAPTPRCRCTT